MSTKRVKRYSPELHHFASDDPEVKMGERPQGMYVLHADYAKLEERILAFMAANGLSWDLEKAEEVYQTLNDLRRCGPGCTCSVCLV